VGLQSRLVGFGAIEGAKSRGACPYLGVTTPAIRKADRADVAALAAALARAFDDDPVMAWLFPDPAGRKRTLPRFFSAHLTKIVLPHGEVYTTGDVAGGALWEPPGKWRLGVRGQLRMLPDFLRLFGRRLGVASRGGSTWSRPCTPRSRIGTWPCWAPILSIRATGSAPP